MFDSPLHFCEACRSYVALDRSQGECAREHGCSPPCPLVRFFSVGDSVAVAGAAADNPDAGLPVAALPSSS